VAPTKPPPLEEVIAATHRDLAERVQKNGWPDLAVGVVIDDKLVVIADREGRIPGQNSPMTIRDAKFIVITSEQPNEKADPTPA